MNKFGENDTVFARVTRLGRELINVRINGICSVQDLIKKLRQQLGEYIGLIQLHVRNITQGWSQTQACYLR